MENVRLVSVLMVLNTSANKACFMSSLNTPLLILRSLYCQHDQLLRKFTSYNARKQKNPKLFFNTGEVDNQSLRIKHLSRSCFFKFLLTASNIFWCKNHTFTQWPGESGYAQVFKILPRKINLWLVPKQSPVTLPLSGRKT